MCVRACVSIGLTEHADRGLARAGLTNLDMTKQGRRTEARNRAGRQV